MTPRTAARQAPLSFTVPEFAQIRVHWVFNAIQPYDPLLPPSPPALNLSQYQGLFRWVGSLQQVAKVLELQLQSSQYSGLTSFRINWFVNSYYLHPKKSFLFIQTSIFFQSCGCAELSPGGKSLLWFLRKLSTFSSCIVHLDILFCEVQVWIFVCISLKLSVILLLISRSSVNIRDIFLFGYIYSRSFNLWLVLLCMIVCVLIRLFQKHSLKGYMFTAPLFTIGKKFYVNIMVLKFCIYFLGFPREIIIICRLWFFCSYLSALRLLSILYTFAGKFRQSYGFSSIHVWMWELDYKESWVPKNSCFWTVVLEKTLESPSDCKEIQPVHPEGNQPWIFIGRTDAEVESPMLWLPDAKNWLIGKDLDAGKDWRQEEKGMTEDDMVGWHHGLDGHEFE